MRDAVVDREFQHFGINHDHPHLGWRRPKQHAAYHAVQPNALTGTCGPCNKQMGYERKIRDDRLAQNVLTQNNIQFRRRVPKFLAVHQTSQRYGFPSRVGHLDADHGLAGNGRHDSHAESPHHKSQIVLKIGDLVHLDAGSGGKFVHGNHRARRHLNHFSFDTKLSQLLLEEARLFHEFLVALPTVRNHWQVKQFRRRQPMLLRRGYWPSG